jgi:DNA-directed RNA polymerase beta' subunit
MVIVEPESEGPQHIGQMYWFFTESEIEEEDGKFFVEVDFPKNKWLPTTKQEAYNWFMTSPNAAGVRAKGRNVRIYRLQNRLWEDTVRGQDGEEEPEDWVATEVYDVSEDMDLEPDYTGVVTDRALKFRFSVLVEADYSLFTVLSQFSAITTSMMSPADVLQLAGDRIIRHDMAYEIGTGDPVFGGPVDRRLGVYEGNELCKTCGHTGNINRANFCPGHFGRVPLESPVPNWLYLSGDIRLSPLVRSLKHICVSCSRITLPSDIIDRLVEKAKVIMYEQNLRGPEGYSRIYKAIADAHNAYYRKNGPYMTQNPGEPSPLDTKVTPCPHCGDRSPQLTMRLGFGSGGSRGEFYAEKGKRDRSDFPRSMTYDYQVVYNFLKEVTNHDALALGFNTEINSNTGEPYSHPSYMFWTEFPISPNTSRPPQESPTGALTENDMTRLYGNVIKTNNRLRRRAQDKPTELARLRIRLFQACTQALSTHTAFGTPELKSTFTGSGVGKAALEGVYDRIRPPGRKKNIVRRMNQSKVSEHVMYSVITPNPHLRLDEVGVPIAACMEMTVAEKVTAENIEEMRELVRRGSPASRRMPNFTKEDIERHYPGATAFEYRSRGQSKRIGNLSEDEYSAFAVDGMGKQLNQEEMDEWYQEWMPRIRSTRRDMTRERGEAYYQSQKKLFDQVYADRQRALTADTLQPGDIVHRHLQRNDWILFTRAPALHRQNIMAARVVPMKQKAFSFNPTICVPFNADYDGDTMRCYVPQSPEAIQEAIDIMDVNKQIFHSRYGRPTIASDQDETSGAYLLTYKNKELAGTFDETKGIGYTEDGIVYLTKRKLVELLGLTFTRDDVGNMEYVKNLPSPDLGEYYTGHAIVSHFIPEGINCEWDDAEGNPCLIRNGVLEYGALDSKGVKNGGMVLGAAFTYFYGYDLGVRKLAEFIDHINRLFFAAHICIGYTIGIEDVSMVMRHFYRNGEQRIPDRLWKQTEVENPEEWEKVSVNQMIQELYEVASAEIGLINEAFFTRSLENLPEVYFTEASRHGLTYDPLNWAETVIGKITSRFDKEVLELTIELQGTSNAMNIAVISGARAKKDNIQQMSGAYGQITVNNYRPISGYSVGRPQTQYPKGDYSGEAFGFAVDSYAEGLSPTHYFLASAAGRRASINSSTGAIQKSGYLEHKLKRATENLVIDERRYLKNVRTGKVLSTMIGDDGLRPFHPRGPDNMDGLRISLQPFFFGHTCVHDVTLHDECRQCEMESGTKVTMRGRILELPPYIRHIFTKTMGERTCNDPASIVTRLYEYYLDSRVEPGEMIGSTGAANVGEPVTQAGLRAFHGGGKGTTPTVERITQLLELAKSEIQQPQTIFYLKEEHDTMENAQAVANFCSILRMGDIIELAEYDDNGSALEIRFDQAVMDTFEVSKSFVTDIINYRGKTQGYNALETADGVRVQYQNTSLMPPRAYLMLMKERLDKLQIHGLVKGARAFADKRRHPTEMGERHAVIVLGPSDPAAGKPNEMMLDADEAIGEYIEWELTQTNNPFYILQEYGLEAALACIKELFWEQMNGNKELGVKGLGEFDFRYIDAMVDLMGETGYLLGLGKTGNMVDAVPSLIGGIGGEDPGRSLRTHPLMATRDKLEGMVEAVAAGRDLKIGPQLVKKSSGE